MKIVVFLALNYTCHNNCAKIPLTIKNVPSQNLAVGKGSKIAVCSDQYSHVEPEFINVVSNIDPIQFLCSDKKLRHLEIEERMEVRNLLTKYKHIFSVSNSHIGRTSLTVFDLPTDNLEPIADPLR